VETGDPLHRAQGTPGRLITRPLPSLSLLGSSEAILSQADVLSAIAQQLDGTLGIAQRLVGNGGQLENCSGSFARRRSGRPRLWLHTLKRLGWQGSMYIVVATRSLCWPSHRAAELRVRLTSTNAAH
jgi:hypothetical protein